MKAVMDFKHVGIRTQRGCIPETDVWLLTLSCGHTQLRTDSRAHVKRAKCKECPA